MRHRHLVDTESAARSPTAVDDIIERGLMEDWLRLRRWCTEDAALLDVVERVCNMHCRGSRRAAPSFLVGLDPDAPRVMLDAHGQGIPPQ